MLDRSAVFVGVAVCATCCLARGAAREHWLEAESFDSLGGWVIDQQSMAQMGSAYVMAHGMGIPVQDCQTVCSIPASGRWTVWVRTRDWTAPWKRGKPAGVFQVKINAAVLPGILGTNGEQWGWQKAGALDLKQGHAAIALHDLTGFNGRCDAIYLTLDPVAQPESDKRKLADFRRRITNTVCKDDPPVYDLAVAGGGISGICTAIAATRSGATVVLIQDRAILGGNNSSEVRVSMGGGIHQPPYPRLGNVVQEIGPVFGSGGTFSAEVYEDARKALAFQLASPSRCKVVLNERVFAVEKRKSDSRRIAAFIAHNIRTGAEQTRYRARLFADCTGDAIIARMMGAEVMYGREPRAKFNESLAPAKGDNQVMGLSVLWYSKKADKPTAFPDVDWGVPFDESNVYYIRKADWEWETGQYRNQAEETEYIRDYGMMAIYANWSYLKNHSKRKAEWARDTLSWVSALGGKRESYRVVGDHVLTQNDVENHVAYPDATGAITWSLDLHFPDPENERKFPEPFRSCAYHRGIVKPYSMPYRCLYAGDVKNLFLGGRHVSTSHVAFSSVRVQRTLGVLGEVIGMAAALSAKEHCFPRDVYETRFDKLKAMMNKGVPTVVYHGGGCDATQWYHFREHDGEDIRADVSDRRKTEDPRFKERIKALNVEHKKWRAGVSDRRPGAR